MRFPDSSVCDAKLNYQSMTPGHDTLIERNRLPGLGVSRIDVDSQPCAARLGIGDLGIFPRLDISADIDLIDGFHCGAVVNVLIAERVKQVVFVQVSSGEFANVIVQKADGNGLSFL